MIEACPPLSGKSVRLLPLLASHAAALFPLLSDEELWRFTESRPPISLDSLRERYERLEGRLGPNGDLWLNWAIERRADGQIAGFVQATVRGKKAEIGYALGRSFWGQGLARDSTSAMLGFLRRSLHIRALHAFVDSRNSSSRRLLEHLGFRTVDERDPANIHYRKRLR